MGVAHPTCGECGRTLLVCGGQLMCVVRTCPKYAQPVKEEKPCASDS